MIPLSRARDHLRVTHTTDDALVERQIAAAVAYMARRTGRYLGEPAVRTEWITGGGRVLWLANEPHEGTVAVFDRDDEVDAETYEVRGRRLVHEHRWHWTELRATYTAGYEEGQLPADIEADALRIVGALYAVRQAQITGSIVAKVDLLTTQKVRP